MLLHLRHDCLSIHQPLFCLPPFLFWMLLTKAESIKTFRSIYLSFLYKAKGPREKKYSNAESTNNHFITEQIAVKREI